MTKPCGWTPYERAAFHEGQQDLANCELSKGSEAPEIEEVISTEGCGRIQSKTDGNGFLQEAEVDYKETFTPVARPGTIRTILALVYSKDFTSII